MGVKTKPQEEAATVAAVSRSEDAADSNMYGSNSACCVLTPACSWASSLVGINKCVDATHTFTCQRPSEEPFIIFIYSQQ